jgi:ubiquitin-protein ligase E3 B
MPFIEAMMLNFFLLFHSNLDRYGLFSQTSASDSNLIPSNSAKLLDNDIDMIDFSWSVGKALYEGILLDYSFSSVFVQKFLGRYCFLNELSTLDPELCRNLMQLKVL